MHEFIDKFVRCPYYKYIYKKSNTIVCEGVDGAASSRLVFGTRAEMEKFMRDRCTSDYCLCVMCRGIHEYYEVDDEQGINQRDKA